LNRVVAELARETVIGEDTGVAPPPHRGRAARHGRENLDRGLREVERGADEGEALDDQVAGAVLREQRPSC
jgi:hypothetical protein